MSYAVVIPSCNPQNLIGCIEALRRHQPDLPPERFIVVDDGARAQAAPALPGITWVDGVRPFVFARNVNRGIAAAGDHDVVLLNDDAQLLTRGGLDMLARAAGEGTLVSAGIQGLVGNRNQVARGRPGVVVETEVLAFVAVYLPRAVLRQVGTLDERFVDYGFEDNDFCRRALGAGFGLRILDACLVEHGREVSSYRSRPEHRAQLRANQRRFAEKWRNAPVAEALPGVDILFMACNRLAFTKASYEALLRNTDWTLVRRLIVLDDGSTDGTRDWLRKQTAPVPVTRLETETGSPVSATAAGMAAATAPVLAKIDNDTMVPPDWLGAALRGLAADPSLDLLGIEAVGKVDARPDIPRTATPAPFVGGIGLIRRKAWARGLPKPQHRWFGYQEWQNDRTGPRRAGWLTPAIPVVLLDRLPFSPWSGLTAEYVARGWQRPWPPYAADLNLWSWMDTPAPARPKGLSFTGVLRIKNEAAHIAEVIDSILPLCDRILVLDDNSTDETPEICARYAPKLELIRSPFEGLDEVRDKAFLLDRLKQDAPDWALWIDGDEVLERGGPAQIRAAAVDPQVAALSLKIAYVWDRHDQVRVDGIYGTFRRPSAFRVRGQPLDALEFRPTGQGGNLHCGNIPQGLRGGTLNLPIRLKHYGYMEPARRQAKYDWYRRVDPGNRGEDEYRHLIGLPGARHAPGPAVFETWTD